jgi:hypothetical protein
VATRITSGLPVIRPLRNSCCASGGVLVRRKGRETSWMQSCFETFQHSANVELFEFVLLCWPVLTYRNPSTRKRSPSECSIPEKRRVWPSRERLGPQMANNPGRSAILRTCRVIKSK